MAARTASKSIRHLLSIADLSAKELKQLVNNGLAHKQHFKSRTHPSSFTSALSGRQIGLSFVKRSTRTRISTEGAITAMGGHPIFLGKDDIQLGVNESLVDTAIVMSSMMAGIVARVGPHADVVGLAEHSSVPVINALSDKAHPMQIVADFMTLREEVLDEGQPGKIAYIGDSNNVLFDLATACAMSGIDIAVASPKGYGIPSEIRKVIEDVAKKAGTSFNLIETSVPEEAIKDADVLATDTWTSMGTIETQARTDAFAGFQVTEKLAKRGGAKNNWKFIHCLPRHKEEVDDEVFYGPRSLVFPEAENRLYSAISVLDTFVVNKGEFKDIKS